MKNINLIDKIVRIGELQKEYEHDWDKLQNEIFIHLKNGDKAYSTFWGFVYNAENNSILCNINGKIGEISLNEVHNIGF